MRLSGSSNHAEPTYYITLSLLIICTALFLLSTLTTPPRTQVLPSYPQIPLRTSEKTQVFLFDFPKAYSIVQEIADTYGIQGLANPQKMPLSGQLLLKEYQETPYWNGYYDDILLFAQNKPRPLRESQAPLFEKIRQGEVWRLFTPAILHYDPIHLLFNMLWLFLLGRQIEQRLKSVRYIIFIIAAGIFSNTAQYMMSGPDFLGFSGVLCAMFTFIWLRQRRAPWEGYQLDRSTIIFISLFIAAMFLIQVASFLSAVYAGTSFDPIIANTGHLSGAAAGVVMGRMNFFAWKQ